MVIHALTKLTPLQRKKLADEYYAHQFNKKELCERYDVSYPTLNKILARSKYGDYTIHSSTNKRYRVLQYGLKRLAKIQARIENRLRKQAIRYEKSYPGELVHLDTKQLPLMVGETRMQPYEYLFVAIDDYSRELYAAIYPDKSSHSAAHFLASVIEDCPYRIERLLTDNGTEYKGSLAYGHGLKQLTVTQGIRHSFTRPYRPQTNGKAERVIRTLMEGWHHHSLKSREQRRLYLARYVNYYNTVKPHKGIDNQTPFERLYEYFYSREKLNNA
jgi:transposase InsO family protein